MPPGQVRLALIYWGNGDMGKFAWFLDNSDGHTHPVGTKDPNAFGLFDMSGNVWEWVQDGWQDNYQDVPVNGTAWEPKEQDKNALRVLRGGSWSSDPWDLPSANRNGGYPGLRDDYIGFRLAQD
jgi:formylglycine-generating enzyme required for sulfatase activity